MADRRVSVNVDADVSPFVRGMMTASAASKAFGSAIKSNEPLLVSQQKQLDRFSGRLALLGEAAVTAGSAFIPLGAAAVPVLAGITAGLGAAAGAAGVAALAFTGLGDALKAIDAYQIQPTAENLAKMQDELHKLGPAGADFARYLDGIEPQLRSLQLAAREGLFPGMRDGIDDLLTQLPQVRQIVANIATTLGDLSAEAGSALSGDQFLGFFNYLETDAAPTLRAFAESVGNVVEGLGHLIVAFAPLSRDFSSGLESMTESFAQWAKGLSQTEGFREFVDYVKQSGPQAIEFLGAIGNAFVGIVTAAAPFGSAVLPVLTTFANILATIAESPIGPPLFTAAAGFIALNRAVSTFGPGLVKLNEAFLDLRTSPNAAATAAERFGGAMRGLTGAAGIGLFVTSLGETNSKLKAFEGIAGGALTGLAVGGPWGAAIGAGVGALTLFGDTTRENTAYIDALSASLDAQTGAFTANSTAVAAKALEDEGLLAKAEALGLNLGLVTEAAMGNKDALAQVNAELERFANVDTAAGVDTEMFKMRKEGAELSKALEDLAGDSNSAVSASKRLAAATGDAADANSRYSASAEAARTGARKTADGFITLGDSLDDAKVSLRGWLRDLEQQAAALEAFGNNALRAARRGLDQGLIKSLQEAGPAGAMRMKQLANATDAELDRANRAWRNGQKAIRDYVNMTVPPKKIRVDTGDVFNAIDAVKYALKRIPDETVNISLIQKRGALDVATRASGGTIPGPRHPYGDKVLAYLAPGEEVITNRNGEADAFRADRAAGRIPRYASGGTVGGGMSLDQRLEIAQALGTIRDLTRQLNDRVDKGRNKGDLVTRGIERRILKLQLEAAERDLRRARTGEQRERIATRNEQNRAKLDEMRGRLDETIGARDALAGGIASGLKSDIWAKRQVPGIPTWLTAGREGVLDPLGALDADIKDAKRFLELETALTARGLSGAAFEEAASRGGLAGLEILGGYSDEQLGQFSSRYNQRESLTTQAGMFAGNQIYGQKIDAQTAEIKTMSDRMAAELKVVQQRLDVQARQQADAPERTGRAVGREINNVAANASRGRGR